MALWRFVLLFALVAGSVLPHCAAATPAPAPAAHHASMSHDGQLPRHDPSKAHVTDACIGCATPVRFALAMRAEPIAATTRYIVVEQKLATCFTALDPPPPRQAA